MYTFKIKLKSLLYYFFTISNNLRGGYLLKYAVCHIDINRFMLELGRLPLEFERDV